MLVRISGLALLVSLSAVSLGACSDDAGPDGAGGDAGAGGAGNGAPIDEDLAGEVAETYARIVHATYEDSLLRAGTLDLAVTEFVETPTADALDTARAAWLASREPYLQSEAFRFYDGPIDNAEDGPEGQINAWPLDEAYIDYVEGDAAAGIVNDPSQEISAEALASLNEQGGEKNIATGYHAVEFLLWGQDFSDDGPGDRPLSDYTSADNADRRGEYLTTVSQLLVDDLSGLVDAWEPDQANYRADFLAESADEQLRRILTGLITLSGFETGGERLQPALDTHDQEDEHSCFSDNTHRDMVGDVIGIRNVYLGSYTRLDGTVVSGPSLHDLVEATDPELAAELEAAMNDSVEKAEALEPPFDQEIASGNADGNARVQALIDALRDVQEPLLEEVFRLYGLTIPAPE